MSSQFTFVSVDVTKRHKRDLVAPHDRLKIRSLAARNPWNRPQEGEEVVPGVRKRRTVKRTSTDPSTGITRTKLKIPHSSKSSASSSPLSSSSSDSSDNQEDEEDSKLFVLPHREALNFLPSPLEPVIKTEPDLSPDSPMSPFDISPERLDPAWSFCVPFEPFMPRFLDHRLNVISQHLPLIDDALIKTEPQSWALNQVFNEHKDAPPFMYATLLLSGAHFDTGVTTHNMHIKDRFHDETASAVSGQEHMLWLKGCSIKTLNEYLSDPNLIQQPKKFSSALAAVSNLASFEYNFGDRDVHLMHMQGSKRLIELHGGLESLDELSRRFYLFTLKAFLMEPRDGSSRKERRKTEFGVLVEVHRDLFREPAKELGYDLDAILAED